MLEKYSKAIFFILLLVTSLLAGVLFFEYRFFKKQAENLLSLQDDYRTYIAEVKKVLQDYNKTKEELDLLNASQEKKK